MTNDDTPRIRLERTYAAPAATIWRLWTTAEGIESWWAPDGFTADVRTLEVRPGGRLVHALTATSPDMVAFVEGAGLPKTTEATKTFVEVDEPRRLTYTSLVDFVPDHEPYEHLTEVELTETGDTTTVVMAVEPLHDEVWTQRLLAGRNNELDNLAALLASRMG